MKGQGLRLDLYNFDLPQHQDCAYILTSPRSLEACRRLSIKPVELLYISRDDYEAAHPEQSLQERLVTYHSLERRRLKRLREARELRDRLLVDEERRVRILSEGGGEGSSGTLQGMTATSLPGHSKGETRRGGRQE
nr:coiled-coil domain-containing protein 177-like [Cherax quadricarinatus]